MAIDTAERRRSVAHIGRHWSGIGLTPNAAPDAEWRAEANRAYPGILSGAVTYAVVPGAMNESIRAFLNIQFSLSQTDVVPLLDRYLDEDTLADKTLSLRELEYLTDVEER